MNFLICCILSFGISSLSKLGLLFYKKYYINQHGYKLKLRNIHSLFLLLDLNSWIDLLIFCIPMINMLKELQNFALYEVNHELFFNKALTKGAVYSKANHYKTKYKRDECNCDHKQDHKLQRPQSTVILNNYRQESINDLSNDLKPKVYTKTKRR